MIKTISVTRSILITTEDLIEAKRQKHILKFGEKALNKSSYHEILLKAGLDNDPFDN